MAESILEERSFTGWSEKVTEFDRLQWFQNKVLLFCTCNYLEQLHWKQFSCVVKLQAQHTLASRVQSVFFVWQLANLFCGKLWFTCSNDASMTTLFILLIVLPFGSGFLKASENFLPPLASGCTSCPRIITCIWKSKWGTNIPDWSCFIFLLYNR